MRMNHNTRISKKVSGIVFILCIFLVGCGLAKQKQQEETVTIGEEWKVKGFARTESLSPSVGLPETEYYEVRYSFVSTLKSLLMLVQGEASKDDVSGPVGIAQVIGEVAEEATPYGPLVLILNLCNIALLLSVNLGVLNLLPLPALDGGRLVFMLIEAVRGKPIPPEKEGMVHFAGFVALMVLMVFVMYNDIVRLFA